MRKFIHGTDKGNASVTALALVIILSIGFISIVPRIIAMKKHAADYKAELIRSIEQSNREILNRHDLH